MKRPESIAITGIDGSGKSTISRKIINMKPELKNEIQVLTCPIFHETPNAPLADISRQLDCMSRAADELGNYELKAIAQYVQTTLFGFVEDFLINTFDPLLMINERHPVIDFLAYGHFYHKLMQKPLDKKEFEIPLKKKLEKFEKEAYESIIGWIKTLGKKHNKELTLWNIDKHIMEIFDKKGKEFIETVKEHTGAQLPDTVIILEVNPGLATERIKNRDNDHKELHEQNDMLEMIRQKYYEAVEFLNKEYPEVKTHIVDMNDSTSIDQTLEEVMGHIF
jgi:thymidylate kinase